MARAVWKVKVAKSATGSDFRTRRQDQGFTLLEVILVLIVMTLVMALTYPSLMRGRTAFHLRAIGRDVISSLRAARETAVTEQKTMMVTIDRQNQKVILSDEVGDGARSFQPPSDVTVVGLTNTGEEMTQEPLTIRFLANGSSEPAQIRVQSETGASLRIVLDPITGSARMLLNQGEKVQ
jgi:general secretion pathway protein H